MVSPSSAGWPPAPLVSPPRPPSRRCDAKPAACSSSVRQSTSTFGNFMEPSPKESKSKEELIIVFKVDAFCTIKSTGRKRDAKSVCFAWCCPLANFTLEMALFELTMNVPWGANQCATIYFVNKSTGQEVELVDEGQIPYVTEQYTVEGKIFLSMTIKDLGETVLENDTRGDVPGPSAVASAAEYPFDNPEEYVGVHDEACYSQADQQDAGVGVKRAREEELDGDYRMVWT